MSMNLVLYENAKRAVAQLLSVDEVKDGLDKAAAVQEYARRARDTDLEMKAAEYRVYCERRLGEFSASASGSKGGRPKTSQGSCEVSRSSIARDSGLPESTLRAKHEPLAAAPESEFEDAVETVKANGQPPTARRVLDTLHSTKSTGNEGADQWNTPDSIIELVMQVMGDIDLDPCSDAGGNICAKARFTQADDGLSQEWHGRVYMNPPYSDARKWAAKLVEEVAAGHATEAMVLVPSRTDTRWFRAFRDFPVCFITGRLTFKGARDPAPFPSALFYVGQNESRFKDLAREIGDVYVRVLP